MMNTTASVHDWLINTAVGVLEKTTELPKWAKLANLVLIVLSVVYGPVDVFQGAYGHTRDAIRTAERAYSVVESDLEYFSNLEFQPMDHQFADLSVSEVQGLVVEAAHRHHVDPDTVLLFAELETGFRNVLGQDGSGCGPMQLDKHAHRLTWAQCTDHHYTIDRATAYLAKQLDRYQGDITKARYAYVCGSADGCSYGKRAQIARRLSQSL